MRPVIRWTCRWLACAVTAASLSPARSPAQNTQREPAAFTPDVRTLVDQRGSELRAVVERYAADRDVLSRRYRVGYSPAQRSAFSKFRAAWTASLRSIDFDALSLDGKADYVLLRNRIDRDQAQAEHDTRIAGELAALMPFADTIAALEEERREMGPIDATAAGRRLTYLVDALTAARTKIETAPRPDSSPAGRQLRIAAYRTAEVLGALRTTLQGWFRYYDGYDPMFSWWARTPYRAADTLLVAYTRVLRERVVGVKRGEDEPIVGLPIGREALLADLRAEMIPYTPEELIAIAQKELDWGTAELKTAARAMGFGDDWKAAMEKVKQSYVPPGKQTDLVRDLEFDGVAFLLKHNLITLPPLAQDVWRIEMMSPEAQKTNPFFLGGEILQVSYPTDSMAEDDKMMSMRGNNPHFSHATVFHEMIPGHHLQGFMNARYFPYRREFSTPFWSEGGAYYWETLFWDLGYHDKPEDRIGALFWRQHRAARIIFSLNFHLGNWTPQQCIEFLIDRVGHERANASAEVRRSFNGNYSPLYQVAYMMGGLQFRALHSEMVDGGKMTNRQFHDFIYTHGSIPVEMVRTLIEKQPLTRDYRAHWKFGSGIPPSKSY